jgi:hypothetical protein
MTSLVAYRGEVLRNRYDEVIALAPGAITATVTPAVGVERSAARAASRERRDGLGRGRIRRRGTRA